MCCFQGGLITVPPSRGSGSGSGFVRATALQVSVATEPGPGGTFCVGMRSVSLELLSLRPVMPLPPLEYGSASQMWTRPADVAEDCRPGWSNQACGRGPRGARGR